MNLLMIGSGGREHCLLQKLLENPEITKAYALPGNGGMAAIAECVPMSVMDVEGVCRFAKEHDIGFAVVAPDDPLSIGMVDALEEIGVPCFGPNKAAAIIESSKAFSKDMMQKFGIPTARFASFSNEDEAMAYIDSVGAPIVVKADGLALGKGVILAQTVAEAKDAVHSMMSEGLFGKSGATVVIEEMLSGPEVSVLAFTDGKTLIPMVSSMDHKRALDNDEGLNTGGMGTVAPNPCYTPEVAERCMQEIFLPTMHAMNDLGRTFRGCLYFGLMITADGPKVIEYNCRFGDPETQVVIPLLQSDLLTVMRACREGTLDKTEVKFSDRHACCVVVASGGYPGSYKKGCEMDLSAVPANVLLSHAGTAMKDGKLVTSGGRVMGVTAVADTLQSAVEKATAAAETVQFEAAYFRHDIGRKALQMGGKS